MSSVFGEDFFFILHIQQHMLLKIEEIKRSEMFQQLKQ